MGRPPKGPGADEGRDGADGNTVVGGRISASECLIVTVEGSLHHCIEIGVASTQKDAAADAAFDRGLNPLRAESLGIHSKAVVESGIGRSIFLRGGYTYLD